MSIDLHCHTKLSNGTLGIDDLVMVAKKRGLKVIAVTDRDTLAGTKRAVMIGDRLGIKVIPGVEFSSRDSATGKRLHILCYMPEYPDRLEGLCRRISEKRKNACKYMIVKVCQQYPITPDFIARCASGSTNFFKQHIMYALCQAGFSTSIYGELYDRLFTRGSPDSILYEADYPDPKEIIDAVHDAGGVAVLAHPGWNDNIDLIADLAKKGLDGVEVWTPRNTEEQTGQIKDLAKKHKLLMTGGSDFCGMFSPTPVKVGDYTMPEEDYELLLKYSAKKRRQMKKQAEEKIKPAE